MSLAGIEWFAGFVALGFAIGAFGTLIGAGGGFVLMPVLLLIYPHERPEHLTAISLAVVFCNALSGSIAYARMGRIDCRSGLMFAAAATPGAVIGALNTSYLSRWQFNLVFSIVLIGVAVAMALRPELHRNPRKPGRLKRFEVRRHLVEADGTCLDWTFRPWVGVVLSFFVGYFSSFLGIGGGIIHVPALVWLLNFPVHIATATSHFILAIMALSGSWCIWRWVPCLTAYPAPCLWRWECCWGRNWGRISPTGSKGPGSSAAWPWLWEWWGCGFWSPLFIGVNRGQRLVERRRWLAKLAN